MNRIIALSSEVIAPARFAEVIHSTVDKAESTSASTMATVENKTAAAVETTKAVKTKSETEVKSGIQAGKENTSSVKPQVNANAAAEVKTATKATVTKQ